MTLDEAADALITQNRSGIVVDTCAMLDVIRAPLREWRPILAAAFRMREELQSGNAVFQVVLPSVVSMEWSANVDTEKLRLGDRLRAHYHLSDMLEFVDRATTSSGISIPDVRMVGFEDALEKVCKELMLSALTLDREDNCVSKAVGRVLEGCAPSGKGRESTKDCIIFEEVLALGQVLLRRGFGKKLVFVSSNTTEFGSLREPVSRIVADLAHARVEFANTLDLALHLATH